MDPIRMTMPDGGTSRIDVLPTRFGVALTFAREGEGEVTVKLHRALAWQLVDMMMNALAEETQDPRQDAERVVRQTRDAMRAHQGLPPEDKP